MPQWDKRARQRRSNQSRWRREPWETQEVASPLSWLCLPARVLACFGSPPSEGLAESAQPPDDIVPWEDSETADSSSQSSFGGSDEGARQELACRTRAEKVDGNGAGTENDQDEQLSVELDALRRRRSFSATSFHLPAVSRPTAAGSIVDIPSERPQTAQRRERQRIVGKLALVGLGTQLLLLSLKLYRFESLSPAYLVFSVAFFVFSGGLAFLSLHYFKMGRLPPFLDVAAKRREASHNRSCGTSPARSNTDSTMRTLSGAGSAFSTPTADRSPCTLKSRIASRSREYAQSFQEKGDAQVVRTSFDSRSNRRIFSVLGVESSQSFCEQQGCSTRMPSKSRPAAMRIDVTSERTAATSASDDAVSADNIAVSVREPSTLSDADADHTEHGIEKRRGTFREKPGQRGTPGVRAAVAETQRRHVQRATETRSAGAPALPAPDASDQMRAGASLEQRRRSREASSLSDDGTPPEVQIESLRIVESWEKMRITAKKEILAEDFCEGMLSLLSVIDALGPAFRIIKIDIRNHVNGIHRSCTKHNCRTLQRLIDAESNRASRWLNPSGIGDGTEHVLWMKRAMQFVYMLLYMFLDGIDLDRCVYHAYRMTLRACHPYIVRKVAENLHRFVPTRAGFLRRIHADEDFVLTQMRRFLKAIEPRLDIIVEVFNANQLEPHCRFSCAELRRLAQHCAKYDIDEDMTQ